MELELELCCCGVGLESDQEVLKLVVVTTLEMTPCQQVMMGIKFIVAFTRSGELYSWGRNDEGQLRHVHACDKSRPQDVIVKSDNGAPDPMVQISTSGIFFH
jgi:alpha-tubulin suppressor-like RCC1 family protein